MRRRSVWTVKQIRALGTATDLPTAACVLGIGRTLAYDLVRAGQFPVPVIRAGKRVIVPVAPLLKLLHVDAPDSGGGDTGTRLDRQREPSVDATTSPADSARRHHRADRRGDHHDDGDHR
jgi:hypothetical protein